MTDTELLSENVKLYVDEESWHAAPMKGENTQ